jgi:murein L,D-transpeptidase YafK
MDCSRRRLLAGLGGLSALGTTPALAALLPQPRPGPRAERILVLKRQRRLRLLAGEQVLEEFRIALGREPRGPKIQRGDFRTPEGVYTIEAFHPRSYYYRALRLSYPSPEDRERAARLGVNPGGDIMIHGLDPAIEAKWRSDHWMFNWTRGCIAVTNREMDVLWTQVRLGTPVEILP